MINVKHFVFSDNMSEYGNLIPIEQSKDIPFEIKRVYYIFDVPSGIRRGFHSHYNLDQMLICVSGSVKILTKTPYEEEITMLDSPEKGLFIGPMVWREMYDFSPGAVLLVLASELYSVSDYIRDYHMYESEAKKYFDGENI